MLNLFCGCLQREEELAKERVQAGQMKKERETATHKEEAERQARKKVRRSGIKSYTLLCVHLYIKTQVLFFKTWRTFNNAVFVRGLRRSCGEPEEQILQIR